MKKLTAVLLVILMVFSLGACKGAEAENFSVGTLKGPTGIGMIQMIDSMENVGSAKVDFTIAGAPDEITAKLLSGELDAACVPMNMAPMLYNKTKGGFQIAAAVTLGVIYIVENGQTVASVDDLKGKTVIMAGKGSTADVAFQYTMSLYGLDPQKDMTIEYLGEHAEVAAKVLSTPGTIALLPEPFVTNVTMKNSDVKVPLDITELYGEKAQDSTLMMSAFVVSKEFAEKYPGTVDAFLEAYKDSVEFVNTDVAAAAELVAKHGFLPSAKVAEKAIPNCNIVFEYAVDSKTEINGILNVFFTYNPASVGGAMPGEDFYYD